MLKGKKVLVVGGAGFLGTNLCENLLLEGASIRVIARNKGNVEFLKSLSFDFEYIEGDYGDLSIISNAMKQVDVVFHLASTTIPSTSNKNPIHDIRTNVIPTIQLLDLAVQLQIKKVIFFSSGGTVYGVSKNFPISEEAPLNPINSYGIHKTIIEKYLSLYKRLYNLEYVVVRISNPYGPWQQPNIGQGVIATYINKIYTNQVLEIWGDGNVIRDYVYVDDVVRAIKSLILYDGKFNIFNIASGRGTSLTQIIKLIETNLERSARVKFLNSRKEDVAKNILSIERANTELNWFPEFDLNSGIINTIEKKFS